MFNRFIDWFCNKVWPLVDSQRQILGIQLDITNACNLACVHCYHPHHKNQGALTYEQWLQVLEQYKQLLKKLRMIPSFAICGGEPLLSPFLVPLLKNIRKEFGDCEITVLSNGTQITPDNAIIFKQLNVQFQISFDGPDGPRHDLIRGEGSFQKTLEGCRILKEDGVSFYHLAVLSQRTAQWISDFFKLPSQTGAGAMHFTRLVIEGYAKTLRASGEDAQLEGLELKKALQTILECAKTSSVPTSTHGALWHLIEEGLGTPNNIGFSGFIIGYRGDFKVSSHVSMTLGNVLEEGMEKLFLQHPVMKRLRTSDIEVCGECKFFNKCRGDRNASFAKYGHFFGPDPGCWLLNS